MLSILAFLYKTYRKGSEHEKDSSNEEHAHLSTAYEIKHKSAACSSRDLREADSTVEQTEVSTDMAA